jgi:hypothetical protein
MNWSAAHVECEAHVLSEAVLGLAVSYSPFSQVVIVRHTRSAMEVASVSIHSVPVHLRCGEHTRFDVAVFATDIHSSPWHVVAMEHTRLLVAVGLADS